MVKDGGPGGIHPGPFDADAATKVLVRVVCAHPCIPKSSIFAPGAVRSQQLLPWGGGDPSPCPCPCPPSAGVSSDLDESLPCAGADLFRHYSFPVLVASHPGAHAGTPQTLD